jgi:hypothetical protein
MGGRQLGARESAVLGGCQLFRDRVDGVHRCTLASDTASGNG